MRRFSLSLLVLGTVCLALPALARGGGSRGKSGLRLPSPPFLHPHRRLEQFPLGSGDVDVSADPRLAKPVTVTCDQAPLGDVGKALTEKTGVRVEVAPEIEDRRLFARIAGQRLADLLVALREMYGLHLATLSRGEPAYRLEPDAKTEQARRDKQEEARDQLRDDVGEVIEWAAAPPSQRYTLLKDDLDLKSKERYAWHSRLKPEQAWAGLAAGSLSPKELEQVLDGQPLRLPVSRLPGAAQQQLREEWTARPVLNDRPPSAQDVGRGWLLLRRAPLLDSPFTRDALFVDGYVPLPSYPDHWGRMESDVTIPYRLYAFQVGEDSDWFYPDGGKEARDLLDRRLPADLRSAQIKKGRARAALGPLASAYAALYDDAGLSVLSDVTPQAVTGVSRAQWAGKRLEDALPLFGAATGRYVTQQGGLFAFRSGQWFAFDANTAPISRIRNWEREREGNGGRITPRIAREAAALTPRQSLDAARVAPWYAWQGDTLTLMRFYGALPSDAETRFLSSEGLPLSAAPREAREALRSAGLLLGRDTEPLLRDDNRTALAMEPDPGSLWFITPAGRSTEGVPFVLKPPAQPLPLDLEVKAG